MLLLFAAVLCGDPGVLNNGAKDGNLYYYLNSVSYSCFPGFVMHGESTISCQQGAVWSGPIPFCEGKHCFMCLFIRCLSVPA